jgi:hypothetical protein
VGVGPRWFPVHAAAPHVRPLFGPVLWGMPALRACGATLHIGTSAVGDAAEPYSPPAAHAHVAALSAPPRAPRSPAQPARVVGVLLGFGREEARIEHLQQ